MTNAVCFPFQLLSPNYIYDGECHCPFCWSYGRCGQGRVSGHSVAWGSGFSGELRAQAAPGSHVLVRKALGGQGTRGTDSCLLQFPQNSSFP